MKIWLFCLWASRQDKIAHTSIHFKPSDTQTPGPNRHMTHLSKTILLIPFSPS